MKLSSPYFLRLKKMIPITTPQDNARAASSRTTDQAPNPQNAGQEIRWLTIGFDGLRPADITSEVMPNLRRFLDENHCWENYLARFPTETYVNHPVIFSGFLPGRHGVIGNGYFNPEVVDHPVFNGHELPLVEAHEKGPRGLIMVPTIGDRLGAVDKTFRTLCANSSGSSRLQHLHADRYAGHLDCCMHDVSHTIPLREREQLTAKYGNGEKLVFPDFKGNVLIERMFFEEEVRRGLGAYTCVWIGEPDHSEHEFGLQADQTIAARKDADRVFGHILDWWEQEGRSQGIQLAVISDHGHVEIDRHIDVVALLKSQGWSVVTGSEVVFHGANSSDFDIVYVGGYTTGLWARDKSAANLARIRDCLMNSCDIGMIFSRDGIHGGIEGDVPGTFSERLVFSNCYRSPDIRYIPRGNPRTGHMVMDNSLAVGCTDHGGLLPGEVHCLFGCAGSLFRAGSHLHTVPASHDDFATTVCASLGLLDENAIKPLPEGRILREAFGPVQDADKPTSERLDLSYNGFSQYLIRTMYQNRIYVKEGGRSSQDGWTPKNGLGTDKE